MAWFSSLFTAGQNLLADAHTPLDAVTALASLVSKPADIDASLDEVRRLTANLDPGQQFSRQATEKLLDVYLAIEQYLITSDPIRTFQQTELRSRLTPEVRQQLETYELNRRKGASATKEHL